MKKFLFTAAISAAILMTIATAFAAVNIFDVPENISVNDYSVVMQPSTKAYIRQCNNALMDTAKAKIIFVTVPTTAGESIDLYAKRLYSAWGVSAIGNNSSTFVLLATEDMEYWAITGEHIESALTDEMLDEILLNYTEPDFSQKNFDAAIEKTFDAIASWYTTAYGMTPFSRSAFADAPAADTSGSGSAKAIWRTVRTVFIVLAVIVLLFFAIKRYLRLYILSKRRKERVTEYKRRLYRDFDRK